MVALKTYESAFRERNIVLAALTVASREMRAILEHDATADIAHLLALREQECLKYAELCSHSTITDSVMVSNAEAAARSGDSALAALGLSVLSLYEDAQELAKEIMTCQAECETILRNRLQATANALKQSRQRRKLDAVYGPAHRHDIPVFMDHKK
jgi:hypothetical protein